MDAAYHGRSCSPPKGHATSTTALSRRPGMAQGEPCPELGPATLTRLTSTPVAPDSRGRGEWNEGRILRCRLGSSCSRVIGSEYRFFGCFCRRDADAPPQEAAGRGGRGPPPLVQPDGPQVERGTVLHPTTVRTSGSTGLRIRLLIADVAATAGTWFILAAIMMPATTAGRQWGAALAATAVTLVAMQLLGLYRSRLCIQRGQERARIVIAVVAGAVTLELLRGGRDRSYGAAIVVAGSCILALMAFRWMFTQWLRAQRVQGRHRRGLVMIGTNEDAVAVWTMLDSQPELGYEVRGIIGRPGAVRTGHTSPAAPPSISFPLSPGRLTPPGFCWWPTHSPPRNFTM